MDSKNLIVAILSSAKNFYLDLINTLGLKGDNIFNFEELSELEKVLDTSKINILIVDVEHKDARNFLHKNKTEYKNTVIITNKEEDIDIFSKKGVVLVKPISLNNLSQFIKSIINFRESEYTFDSHILKSIYSSSSDGIYVLDENFIIQYANPVILDKTSFNEDEILGKDISTIINHPKKKTFSLYPTYKTEAKLTVKEESHLFVFLTITAITELNTIKGYIGIFNDVAEQKKEADIKAKELRQLLYKDKYHSTQQDMAFKKQLRIIKNDLDHVVENSICFQTYYKPLDILSGDTYGLSYIEKGKYLIYIIDAMGKGLSASVTSIQSSAFINHAMKKARDNRDLNFHRLLDSYLDFIKDRLLDNELVSAAFIYINEKQDTLDIASFGMPPILLQKEDESIEEIKTNNLPIMDFTNTIHIDTYTFSEYIKVLVKSDGFEECQLKDSQKPYGDIMKENFQKSYLVTEIVNNFKKVTKSSSDDLTMIMLTKFPKSANGFEMELSNNPGEIEDFIDAFGDKLESYDIPLKELIEIKFTLNELILNAIEHGNLEIDYKTKQELLFKDEFDKKIGILLNKDEIRLKKVKVSFNLIDNQNRKILYFTVTDCGEGFDVANFFKYMDFDASKRLHGRGIIISDSLNNGIFYNKKGNSANFIKIL